MEGSSANRKPVSDGGIMEQADVPEEGDSLVGGWGRRALSSARTSPARRLINARKLACTFHMEKLIQKTASHSKLENGTIKLVERPQQRINMAFRAHVVPGDMNHSITIDHESRTNYTLIDLAVQFLLTIRTIETMHSQIGIRQQRKRQMLSGYWRIDAGVIASYGFWTSCRYKARIDVC